MNQNMKPITEEDEAVERVRNLTRELNDALANAHRLRIEAEFRTMPVEVFGNPARGVIVSVNLRKRLS